MQRQGKTYLYTPGDLVEFFASPFASWMSRRYCDDPAGLTPDPEPAELASLAVRGQEHEHAVLAALQKQGRSVYPVPSTGDRVALTLAAMRAGHDVIYQAALTDDQFFGIADFLLRVNSTSDLGDYQYEVWEAKLSRQAQPEFMLQLCCYMDLLTTIQGTRPQFLRLVLGDGVPVPFRTEDYFYYYRRLKAAFLRWMDHCSVTTEPLPELGGTYGRWTSVANARLQASDDLSLVATITTEQIRKLQAVGIRTMTSLATTTVTHIPKLETRVFLRLHEQAELQMLSAGCDRPEYRIVPADPDDPRRGLALLPPSSPLDIFFDMEGYPLREGGLEYLFGATITDGGVIGYCDWWAHDRMEERLAFEQFIDWVYARWRTDPSMHIYHYAAYEVTALRRLMGRHGTREEEVDTLLRNEVFVDLYMIVRQGLRVGTKDYSLKSLEKLYRLPRAGEVTTAGDSIVFYDRWLASGESRRWQESAILRDIRDYNRDDCESTWQFVQWLRERQAETGIFWLPSGKAVGGVTLTEATSELLPSPEQQLATRLLAAVPPNIQAETAEAGRWHLQQLLGHVVEFHRREDKPVWWAMFDRRAMTEDELVEDLSCLGGLQRRAQPPEQVKQSLGFWYDFVPEQETKLDAGSHCFFAHDLDMQTEIHRLDRRRGRVCLKFGRTKLQRFPAGLPPERLSLIPDDHVSAKVIASSIAQTAARWLEHQQIPPALEDFLLRRQPRFAGHTGGPIIFGATDIRNTLGDLLTSLDRSTLCIQGPPGAGKTTVAAHAILTLLKKGKRVGVTANSHAAILNVLSKCHELGDGTLSSLKIGGGREVTLFVDYPGATYAENLKAARAKLETVSLVGGTAWVFSDPTIRGSLDYLFVDEAGQVSVANLIGMAPAAQNLVLIGDQMQLGQPIQGSHPGESGLSVLDYLLRDKATIPEDLGIFLGTTWRLHPQICEFISTAVYDGRLQAAPQTQRRVIRVPHSARRVQVEAGVLFVSVEHVGNSQGSIEEVAVIRELVDELVGREMTDVQGKVLRRLQLEDILFVAPYNLQVRNLSTALGPDARVGSVDKFQGQEAPVVVISMCSSEGASSVRGIEFLFNKNRLNVALSRAQSLAIVVGNPRLAETRCSSLAQMSLVNLFCRVVETETGHEDVGSGSRDKKPNPDS
ncbi:MAG: TM0106 family RecB-like putative nuclease [Candidatus Binatia bacterium]